MPERRRRSPTPGQRQQRSEERHAKLAELHTQLVEKVATLADGDQWRAWLAFAARFHTYSFNNQILILMQRPDATWVGGIRRWNAMGRRVRKGEKGIAILAPVTARAESAGPETDPPEIEPAVSPNPPGTVNVTGAAVIGQVDAALAKLDEAAGKPGRVLRGFKITHVWDISQTEGEPVEEPRRPGESGVDAVLLSGQAPAGVWDALVGIAVAHGYRVERGDCGGANGYIRYADQLIKVRDDVDDAQAVKTLAHELGHMLLHSAGDFVGGITGQCRGEKEVEAESVAFLTAAHVGLDTSDYTFGYVTVWAERAAAQTGKPPHEVVQATGARVVRAAGQLTTALDDALGQGEPPVAAQLAQQVATGVEKAAQVRTVAQNAAATAQAGLFDTTPAAARAFPPPTLAPPATTSPSPIPPPGAIRGRHR